MITLHLFYSMPHLFRRRKWKVLSTTYKLKTPYLNVRRDRCETLRGNVLDYHVIERKNAVAIVALTVKQKVVLIRQYRHPVQKWLLEVPAGLIEEDEDEKEAVKRELLEETGYAVSSVAHLGRFYYGAGILTQQWSLYLGVDARLAGGHERDPGEDIEVVIMDFASAVRAVRRGKIKEFDTAFALLMANEYYPLTSPETNSEPPPQSRSHQ